MKKFLTYLFLSINAFTIAGMLLCAYSTLLHPHFHPNWSYLGLAFPVFVVANVFFVLFWLVFKWRLASVPLVGMLLCAGSIRTYSPINFFEDVPKDNDVIKFMSFNVFKLGHNKEEWKDNKAIKYLIDSHCDIVCIQEGEHLGASAISDLLRDEYPYIQTGTSKRTFLAILSKFPIIESDTIHIESKTNACVYYKLLRGNDTILVINNHLESYGFNSEEKENYKALIRDPENEASEANLLELTDKLVRANKVRAFQADAVEAFVKDMNKRYRYVVSCGDFNDPSISYVHNKMTETLSDAYTLSGNGPGISYHKAGMYFRIDNILVSDDIKPYHAYVDNNMQESDHYPIICWLKLIK